MNLMGRLKAMWRRHDERLVEEGLQARAAGEELDLVPGLNREIGTPGFDRELGTERRKREDAAEHEEPQ